MKLKQSKLPLQKPQRLNPTNYSTWDDTITSTEFETKGPFKAEGIQQAEQIFFRYVQNESLPNISKSITNSKEISKNFNIAKLSPFTEEDGTTRVRGRLKHSNLDYNAKQPIFLTAKHLVVQLPLERAHRYNLHEGTVYARRKNSPTRVLDHRIQKCIKANQSRCVKYRYRNANKIHPQIADLLRERLNEHVFALTHAGVH